VTRITLQDGKIVIRDGKVGTEEACCCGECEFVGCRIYYSSGTAFDYEFNYWNGVNSFDPFETAIAPTCDWWGEGTFAAGLFVTGTEDPEFDPNTGVCGLQPFPETAPGTFTAAAIYVIDTDCCEDFLPPFRGEGNEFDPIIPMPFVEVDCEEFAEFFPNLPRCNLPP
jgi:hypothetical protein